MARGAADRWASDRTVLSARVRARLVLRKPSAPLAAAAVGTRIVVVGASPGGVAGRGQREFSRSARWLVWWRGLRRSGTPSPRLRGPATSGRSCSAAAASERHAGAPPSCWEVRARRGRAASVVLRIGTSRRH
jgi:hypothetical protein